VTKEVKNIRKVLYFIIWASSLMSGCTEVFDPQVSASNQILVVDGMITNAVEPYIIKLSFANSYSAAVIPPYISTTAVTGVNNAVVSVADDAGNLYIFTDMGNGTYVSNPSMFTGVIGRTYTLFINSSNGIYQSAPQLMTQTFPIDSIYGTEVNINGPGEMIRSFVNINIPSGFTGNFRFTDSLLMEWMEHPVSLDDVINLVQVGTFNTPSQIVDHELAPIYMASVFYGGGSGPDFTLYSDRWLFLRVYGINNDTYNIYSSMNGQLVTGTQLFDPIVSQVQGNITCSSDPARIVLGKFEASSYIRFVYEVVTDVVFGTVQYISNYRIPSNLHSYKNKMSDN